MILPAISPRVKEHDDLERLGIYRREVRALMKITVVTGPCEVLGFIAALVLTGGNVFKMKRVVAVVILVQVAVFTPTLGAFSNEFAQRGVHQAAVCPDSSRRAFAWRTAIMLLATT
jgi:hypothetical protein